MYFVSVKTRDPRLPRPQDGQRKLPVAVNRQQCQALGDRFFIMARSYADATDSVRSVREIGIREFLDGIADKQHQPEKRAALFHRAAAA